MGDLSSATSKSDDPPFLIRTSAILSPHSCIAYSLTLSLSLSLSLLPPPRQSDTRTPTERDLEAPVTLDEDDGPPGNERSLPIRGRRSRRSPIPRDYRPGICNRAKYVTHRDLIIVTASLKVVRQVGYQNLYASTGRDFPAT
jgi:hypothetical protein